MSSPVLSGNLLFGLSDRKMGQFFCLNAATGKTLWESEGRLQSSGAIVNAGSVWLVLTSGGELIVVKPSETAFEPIERHLVTETHVWAHPIFLGNRILIKDESMLKSLAIGPADGK
jgi:hypothetical protein